MLDGEATVHGAPLLWDGDLKRFSTLVWAEDGDLAAMVMVRPDRSARCWMNLRLVHPNQSWWVWMRLRTLAERRGSDVLMVEDVLALPSSDDRTAMGA